MEFQDVYFEGRYIRRPVSPYVYRALDHRRNEFRLVRLQKSSVSSTAIALALENHSLLDFPEFIALSYEWGHPEAYEFIAMDGVNIPVTVNLRKALKQLREHDWTLL